MKPSRAASVLKELLATRWPVFLWGPPGAGKSSVVRQVASSSELPLVDIRASLLDPTDLRGIPTVIDGRAHWSPPSFLPDDEDEPGLLFFDELNAAAPLIQASLYQLVLDRRVGEYELPEGWHIAAAGNRQEDRSVVFRMPAALANRFVHLDFEIDYDDWRAWAVEHEIHPLVIGFLALRREMLSGKPEAGAHAFPTPRSWEIASDAIGALGVGASSKDVLIGIVGEGAAIEFLGYCEATITEEDVKRVLADPGLAELPTDLGHLYALVSYITARASDGVVLRSAGALLPRLEPEFAVLMTRDLLRVSPTFVADPGYLAFVQQHQELIDLTTTVPTRLQRLRVQLMLRHPFLAAAIARLPIVDGTELGWCATAATDGYNVFVDHDFFDSLSDADARFVLAHEYLHVILGHGDRRRDRSRQAWNLATDFAVNQTLVEFGFDMPASGLFDRRFRGETAEAIYEALLDDDGMRQHKTLPGGETSAGLGEGGVGLGDADTRLAEALTDAQRARLVATGGWDIQLDATDPEGAASTAGDEGSLTEIERRQLRQALTSALREAAHGRGAGYLVDEIDAASEPYVSWEALLAQFVGGVRRSDYRTFPFNKKHVHRGLYLPSLAAPGPEHLVVAMDTSGSIYRDLATAFLAEIDTIRSTGECRLTLLQCDASIEDVAVFESWDEAFVDQGPTRIYGRGGTSFVPPFDWVEERLAAGDGGPDALIYLTDGYGRFPSDEPGYPVLWVLSADGVDEKEVPFGSVLRMPRLAKRR